MNWTSIVNTAKRVITVTQAEVSKVIGVAGKNANAAIKLFIKCEPVAVTVLTPLFPEAAVIVGSAYAIAEKVETDLAAPGATKLQMATGIMTDALIPTMESGLTLVGKTIDQTKVAAVVPDLFNAIVAENNAQAQVSEILAAAASAGTVPNATALATAEQAVATAVAQVKTLGAAIQAAVTSIAPAGASATAALKS
jgi:hypothetical protein